MRGKEQLAALLSLEHSGLQKWVKGRVPKHYKRISLSMDEAEELAKKGQKAIWGAFHEKLHFTQAVIAGSMLSKKYHDFVFCTPSQYGKALADDTPVLTKDGWKNHGDLKVGDYVIGLDGKFVKVLAVHPKCEMDRVVTLQNGDTFVCHHNHEWVYTYSSRGKKEIRSISVSRMEERGLTQSKDNVNKFIIPRHKIVEGEEKELSVPPYVMGVWLGDGSTTKGQICSCKKDIAVLDKCRKYYPDGSEWEHKDTGVITRSFVGLANDLTAYNMCFQRKDTPRKHIPDEYLTASVEQRLELLAGLIDTDGYSYADERYDYHTRTVFTTADETLKDSFESLISTFGWRTSTLEVEPRLSTSGIQGRHKYWVIGFTPSCEIPCTLERKRVTETGRFNRGVGIVNIEETKGVQGNCITVEGGIYLVGKHLIPTHNSWIFARVAILRAYKGHNEFVAGARKDTTQVIMSHVYEALQKANDDIVQSLVGESKNQIDRLNKSVSKAKISFANGGSIEPITFGDTYGGLTMNSAIGRGGDYIIDEAALISEDALAESGRADFTGSMIAMISNPHKPGTFYSKLAEDDVTDGRVVIWADALTAVEEQRFTKKQVLESTFADNKSTLNRYLLCDLDLAGDSMFDTPKVVPQRSFNPLEFHFLGVDAAYKGKDNICVSLISISEDGHTHCDEIATMDKSNWIDGVTNVQIVNEITRWARKANASLVCVDQGWGVWLIQGLIANGVNALGVAFAGKATPARVRAKEYAATNAQNLRAEMHLDLQNLIEDGMFDISEDAYEQVKDILPFVLADRKASGLIQIRDKNEIKRSIGRSPDELDSVLLAVHAAIVFFNESLSFIA